MMMPTAAGISVLVASTVTGIYLLENLVEWAAAEEFSENFFGIAEHKRETTEDEIILEWIMLRVSSSVMVAVICFVVS